jgi:pimeloyl-ACP methyl ester carboxylesterase
MAQHAAVFIDALGIKKVDALGFSMGGLIAQQFTIDRPDLVQKLILVGTGPRSSGRRCCRQIVSEQIFYKGIIG